MAAERLPLRRPLAVLAVVPGTGPHELAPGLAAAALRLGPGGTAWFTPPPGPLPRGGMGHALADFLEGADLAGWDLLRTELPALRAAYRAAGVRSEFRDVALLDLGRLVRGDRAALRAARAAAVAGGAGPAAVAAAARAGLTALLGRRPPGGVRGLEVRAWAGGPRVDRRGYLVRVDGRPVVAFGKYRGAFLADLAREDPGYLEWMLQADFPEAARAAVRAALAGPGAAGIQLALPLEMAA